MAIHPKLLKIPPSNAGNNQLIKSLGIFFSKAIIVNVGDFKLNITKRKKIDEFMNKNMSGAASSEGNK